MKTLTLLTLLLVCAGMYAAPPPPWLLEESELGEANLQSYFESYADARARGVDAANPIYGPFNPPFGPNGALSGTDEGMNVLILLVDFTDNVAQTPAVYFDSMGFAADTFSLKNYYSEVSFGQIDIVTLDYPSTTGWQRAPETYEYYVANNFGWGNYPANSQGMVEDVCELVDPYVDFSQYDNDSDGYVDGVNVMFAGQFDGTPQTIWPHAWSLPGGGVTFDGVKVYSFSVQNEYDDNPGDKSAAVFCHEFGHVIGLPDLYDYDYDSNGIGDWGLMSFGLYNGNSWSPAHFCAWSRADLGITTPVNITSAGYYDVPSVELSGTIYRLWTNGSGGNEYYLVENRRPIGYDAALPGWGVLIWHVDDNVSSNDNQWYPGHTSFGHYHVALEQADGLWELEQEQSYGDQEDPFPGPSSQNADAFNYWTVPDSRDYSFEDTYVEVSSIPESADTVNVYFSVDQTGIAEGNLSVAPGILTMAANPANGSAVFHLSHNGGEASLKVFDISGREVAVLLDGELPQGDHTLLWEGGTGIYFARYEGNGILSGTRFLLVR
ncbi:MAG: M6 family metalloprotease domain-containing protein [Candidatus Aegiribacteria sp.]|nr:M6 family metalloprotease domain-containing protein [Candidatus Aegiribacteria sp.]